MHKVKPTKHEDGAETVKLYGKTIDVTGQSTFTLFKKQYKVVRPKKKSNKSNTKEEYTWQGRESLSKI